MIVAVGGSARIRVVVDQALPDGTWQARLRLVSGTVARTAEGKISLPVQVPAALAEPAGTVPLATVVATIAALAGAVVALVGYLAYRSRRHGRRVRD